MGSSYETPAALYKMLPVSEAIELVLSQVTRAKPAFECCIQETVGHVLAQDVVATTAIPDKPLSIKDGFAIKAGDKSRFFSVVGENRAGNVDESIEVVTGAVCYVTTGSPIPKGADAVVMIEDTTQGVEEDHKQQQPSGKNQKTIRLKEGIDIQPGQDVRQMGSDMALGEVILHEGKLLSAADVGMLASLGIPSVKVFSKPKAAVMSTGDEVYDISNVQQRGGEREKTKTNQKGKHQIFDSNRPILYSLAGRYCGEVLDLGIAGDTQEGLESLFKQAMEAKVDVLVTSGGVSMGDSDLIKPILEKEGHVHFGKVKMKPGKPLTFATLEQQQHKMMVFGLPGNPVSSFVTFHLVVIPALRKLAGWGKPNLTRIFVRAAEDFVMDHKRPEYHRVTLRWDEPQPFGVIDGGLGCLTPSTSSLLPMATSTGNQISSRLTSLRGAHALMEVPQGQGIIRKGSVLSALLLGEINL